MQRRSPTRYRSGGAGAPLIEKVRFAEDSPLEGDGFEPSVPRKRDPLFKSAQQRQRAVHNELCDRRNDQVLDAAKFSRETAPMRPASGVSHQKTVGNKGGPS
jgi:hypothetical protein